MKKVITLLSLLVVISVPVRTQAQSQEAVQLILNYEKLQQLEEILDSIKRIQDTHKDTTRSKTYRRLPCRVAGWTLCQIIGKITNAFLISNTVIW
jgi:hypothetical protein